MMKLGMNSTRRNVVAEITNRIINMKFKLELNKINEWISVKNNEMLNYNTFETRPRTEADKFSYCYDAVFKNDITDAE